MMAALGLLAVVLPAWEQMRTRRVVSQQYDETLPDGSTIRTTFVGWVSSVDNLPARAEIGDEMQVSDGTGTCWIWVRYYGWVDP